MSNNPKIILNRAKKGKILSDQEIEIFFSRTVGGIDFGFEYVNDILKKRSLKFELEVEKYCNHYQSMWGIRQDDIMFYIKRIIKGPWPKIEKYFDYVGNQRYKLFLKENNFEEHLI
jgi:hypothetical protein